MAPAATGDTWGIPGPTFLLFFGCGIVAVAVLAAIHRRILFHGGDRPDVSRLGPQQVAYLNGGDKLAVYAALGGLRAAGALGNGPDRTLVQTGHLPSGVTPLDTAVYNAAGRGIRARDVNSDQWVVAAVTQLRETLERNSLATTQEQRTTARLWGFAGLALVVIGIVRLVAGLGNKPVGFLFLLVLAALIVTMFCFGRSGRMQTYAATKGMRDLRKQHLYLSPRQSPSYATYGAAGAAMGVALYGAASLYAMDPAFAAEAEIQRISASGGTGSGFAGDSGSSSCSSGSSCSGGSSCGGGGCGG